MTAATKRKRTRYVPRGQRDLILFRTTVGGKSGMTEARHQDPDVALVDAQRDAVAAGIEIEIEVIRRPIGLGRQAVLYRVVRDEDGVVLTHRVDLED